MVEPVLVEVEEIGAGGRRQPVEHDGVPALGHVDDALQHAARLPSARPRATLGAMGSIGAPELLILLVVILVLFGGAKLPKLARSLGQAQKEFKEGISESSKPEDPDQPSS